MADLLPGFAPPATPRRRTWHNYDDYRLVHERQVAALVEAGVILDDSVEFREQVSSLDGAVERVRVYGRLHLSSGAFLDVDKWLSVRDHGGRMEVRAEIYAYHAQIQAADGSVMYLFRYDNTDDDDLASLHRHRFFTDGVQCDQTEAVDHDRMPYLNEVIEEADQIGWTHPLRS